MTDPPGPHPLLHPELAAQAPLIFTVKEGDALLLAGDAIRIHDRWVNRSCLDDPAFRVTFP